MAEALVRLTVNLTARSSDALDRLAESLGCNKTDVINRALQIADHVTAVDAAGGRLYVREDGSDELERLRFL